MKEKNIKLIMELIFIFILPLLILLPCVSIYDDYVYDSYGNYVSSNKVINFDSFFNSYKDNIIISDSSVYIKILDSYDIIGNRKFFTDYLYFSSSDIKILYKSLSNLFYVVLYDNFFNEIRSVRWENTVSLSLESYDFSFYRIYRDSADTNINISDYFNSFYFVTVINSGSLTLFGRFKLLFIEFLNFNDSPILDLFISYNFLWLMMFVSWHLMYAFLDFVIHIVKIRKRE